MADVKELNINNTTYAIKDAVARNGLTTKQDILVSGTNIKTINNQSILGSGNLSISADNIFWATYGTTTYADIQTAINDGKLVLCTYNGSTYYYDGSGGGFISFTTNTVGTNYVITVDSSDNWTNDSRAFPTKVSDLTDDTATYPIDKAKTVVDQNSGSVKMWTGTRAQYDAIVTKDNNTLYNITDDNTADAYEAYTKSEVDTLITNALNDALYYKAGDTYIQVAGNEESAASCWSGFLTSSATDLRFTMILPKSTKNVSTATISVLDVIARGAMGYLDSQSSLDLMSLGTVTARIFDNRLYIRCVNSAAFTNAQNNTPVAISIRGITVTFS